MNKKDTCLWLSVIFVLVLIVSISFANIACAENAPLKIGIVDINKIMKDSKAGKNARAAYQKDFESKKALVKEKSDKLAAMDKDLKNTKQDSPAWKEKREKLAQAVKELRQLQMDVSEQLKNKDIELTRKIIADLQQILNKLVKSESYSLIIDKKSVLADKDGLDITDKVMKMYDAQSK